MKDVFTKQRRLLLAGRKSRIDPRIFLPHRGYVKLSSRNYD